MRLTVGQIAEFCQGEILYGDAAKMARSVSIDTRKATMGGVFIALKGEEDDGHQYVNRAIKEGAVAILVSSRQAAEHVVGLAERKGCAAILVTDTLKALQRLAREWLEIVDARVIGITGSTGKTSTKEIMACVLGQRFKVAYTDGNQNNEIGVPLTVLGAEEDDEILIVEMGMRGRGQITELCDIVSPTIGVITSIGSSHIDLLGSMEEIVEAKAELLRALPKGGLAVFEADKPYTERLKAASAARSMTVGIDSDEAKLMATKVQLDASGCPSAHIMSLKGNLDIALAIAGRHQLANALLVIAVAQELGLSAALIEKGLEQARLTGMRFKIDINHTTEVMVINDAYNANPNSMEQAILTLASMEVASRRVCVLGDMLELGKISPQEHYKIGATLAHANIDALFSYGDFSADMVSGAQENGLAVAYAYDWIELDVMTEEVQTYLHAGDCVLVKASRGMELERVAHVLLGDEKEDGLPVVSPSLREQPTQPLVPVNVSRHRVDESFGEGDGHAR